MPDPGLRRVCVHAGAADIDLTLPSMVPIAVLIASIVDVLDGLEDNTDNEGDEDNEDNEDNEDDTEDNEDTEDTEDSKNGEDDGGVGAGQAYRYELGVPGAAALAGSTTLADNDIRDGTVLVLLRRCDPPMAPRYDDPAHAVSATLALAVPPWDRRSTRLAGAVAAIGLSGAGGLALIRNSLAHDQPGASVVAACASLAALLFAAPAGRAWGEPIAALALSLISTCFASAAGFLAVPGRPGIANVLLGAAAGAATSFLAMRAAGCGLVTLTAISCAGSVIGAAALVGVATAAPLQALGSASVMVSLALLEMAARMAIGLAGLSPRLPTTPAPAATGPNGVGIRAIRADRWLTSLLSAFAATAAAGGVVTVLAGAPRLCCGAFGALTGALLLLRSRDNDARRTLVFVVTGITAMGTTFGVAAIHAAGHGPWVAAGSAVLAGAAMCLGFVIPGLSLSPVVQRGVALLESSALVATVPLACWICGLYGAVRGLVLR